MLPSSVGCCSTLGQSSSRAGLTSARWASPRARDSHSNELVISWREKRSFKTRFFRVFCHQACWSCRKIAAFVEAQNALKAGAIKCLILFKNTRHAFLKIFLKGLGEKLSHQPPFAAICWKLDWGETQHVHTSPKASNWRLMLEDQYVAVTNDASLAILGWFSRPRRYFHCSLFIWVW